MTRIIDQRWWKTGSPDSRVKFELAGEREWSRYLMLDGRPAYLVGGNCDTCGFLFERMDGANDRVQVEEASDRLRDGFSSLAEPTVELLASRLPSDEYLVVLLDLKPRLVRPGDDGDYFCHEQIDLWGVDSFYGLPHYPRVPYYRGGDRDLGGGAHLFEFLVPMFPSTWLDPESTAKYRESSFTLKRPTALAVSLLDVRSPAKVCDPARREYLPPGVGEHWCLAHYLLDGHHKVYAAAEAGRTVRLLAFVSCTNGISTREQVARILE